jgi:proton-dependent oligopeptide transporter, POT family
LSEAATELIRRHDDLKKAFRTLSEDDLARMNRFLLEDTYTRELTQNQAKPVSFVIPAGWAQSVGPLFVFCLAPIAAAVWLGLGRRGRDLSLPAKFAFGLVFLGLGFLVMWGAAKIVVHDEKVWPTWLIATFLIHTIGELCVSPVGLSSVTKLAPKRMVGQMMGIWFLATSLGNLFAGMLAGRFNSEEIDQMPALFMQIVLFAAGTGLLVLIFSKPIKKLMVGVK